MTTDTNAPALLITPQADGSWKVEATRQTAPIGDDPVSLAERWLTSQEMAELTGIGSTTWEGLAKRGEIPHVRCGKALRFVLSEVRAALKVAAP